MAFVQAYSDDSGNVYPAAHFQVVTMGTDRTARTIWISVAIWRDTAAKAANLNPVRARSWDFILSGKDYTDMLAQSVSGLAGPVMVGIAQAALAKRPEFAKATVVPDV